MVGGKAPVNGQKSRMEFSRSSYLHIDLFSRDFSVRFFSIAWKEIEGETEI